MLETKRVPFQHTKESRDFLCHVEPSCQRIDAACETAARALEEWSRRASDVGRTAGIVPHSSLLPFLQQITFFFFFPNSFYLTSNFDPHL